MSNIQYKHCVAIKYAYKKHIFKWLHTVILLDCYHLQNKFISRSAFHPLNDYELIVRKKESLESFYLSLSLSNPAFLCLVLFFIWHVKFLLYIQKHLEVPIIMDWKFSSQAYVHLLI